MPSPSIYENLPLYARVADERQILRHVCDAIQPPYDEMRYLLSRMDFFFDPDHTPAEFLDWFGQIVGLAPIDDQWLGLGLNPEWGEQHKRDVIKRAWLYWQLKGTDWAIREALDMWLQWRDSHTDRLLFTIPFGKTPTAQPPGWWDYQTCYGDQRLHPWTEIKRLGMGDNPREGFSGAAIGPYHTWLHLNPTDADWNKLFPDIYTLNPEIWDAHRTVTVFGWIEPDAITPIEIKRNPAYPATRTVTQMEVQGWRWGDQYPVIAIEV